jgi:SNF2 family DNA or RNA helicase
MLEVRWQDNTVQYRPQSQLELVEGPESGTPDELLEQGRIGPKSALQRLLTFEKLKGTLHDVIYAMEAAQIEFHPYQFKPVLKFIDSPNNGLLIADEVGLGKTIEAMLVWTECVARFHARRLLIVCTKMLAEKWRLELRAKFMIEASIVDAERLSQHISDLQQDGAWHSFALIATYTGLRPPRTELQFLDEEETTDRKLSARTRCLQQLHTWQPETYQPFDMVIFDEAHYMRNSTTTTFRLGDVLARAAANVICVSATPVNNRNSDLYSLLKLIDPQQFPSEIEFASMMEENRATVRAANALSALPFRPRDLREAAEAMGRNRLIENSPWLSEFRSNLTAAIEGVPEALARCRDLVEKLNLLSPYINRTRRVQVRERRPIREPHVLTLDYGPEERALYDAVRAFVRQQCQHNATEFHTFSVIGMQLRATSCLPVLAAELRSGRFGDAEELLAEAIGENMVDADAVTADVRIGQSIPAAILSHDFEASDRKYQQLTGLLRTLEPTEKVVLFAFYRGTLEYLRRRLSSDRFAVAMIHGGVSDEERQYELERFRDFHGRMILLSSEVGSEGIDLQFARVLVNYDLPWNPMRIEQRIGRIDRIGQKAARLKIVNFKVRSTVEERLFDSLHDKLAKFANSLGDLEEVIGKEVQSLTRRLLSQQLTPQQEIQQIEQSSAVIENRLRTIRALEESGDALLGLGDYLQDQLTRRRDQGNYILPSELEDYISDFFEQEFPGCSVMYDSPAIGCLTIRLTSAASQSLRQFIGGDRSLTARPFQRSEFSITFRSNVIEELPDQLRRHVTFANHQSPFIRWITERNRQQDARIFRVSGVQLQTGALPPGLYRYRIEHWTVTGVTSQQHLAYGVSAVDGSASAFGQEAEQLIADVCRSADTLARRVQSSGCLVASGRHLDDELQERYGKFVAGFYYDNRNAIDIRRKRVQADFGRRIEQDERRLRSAMAAERSTRIINLAAKKVEATKKSRDEKLQDLLRRREIDASRTVIAAGLLEVLPP